MEEAKMYFATDDPNCFLDLKRGHLQNLSSVTVTLNFIALAADALQQIVQFQQKQLKVLTSKKHDSTGKSIKAFGKALQKLIEKTTRSV